MVHPRGYSGNLGFCQTGAQAEEQASPYPYTYLCSNRTY